MYMCQPPAKQQTAAQALCPNTQVKKPDAWICLEDYDVKRLTQNQINDQRRFYFAAEIGLS